jgi:hypothetical protein
MLFFKGASQIYQASWVHTNLVWNLVFISHIKITWIPCYGKYECYLCVFNILNNQTYATFFLNDIHECSCLIHKKCMNLIKM